MFVTKKSRLVLELLTLALACAPLVVPTTASAIPAFSRQHKTECSTCHTIYPELNEFGDAFLKNSYVYPAGTHGASKPAGGEKQGRTEGLVLSGIPEQIPISLTATLDAAYNDDAVDTLDLSTRSLRLHAGGSFRDVAGFFVTYNLYAQGVQSGTSLTPNNTQSNINELYLVVRQALDTPVTLRIGRMEPKTSLWKKSNRVILVPSYASTTYNLGAGSSQFSLDTPQDALEANGLLTKRLFVAAGVVDGKGQDNPDAYGHISLKIGGTDFMGNEPEVDLEKDSVWDYLSVTLGAFGYAGRNSNLTLGGIPQNTNNFYRAGAEMDVLYKRLHLKGSGAFGGDDNPTFSPTPGEELETHAYAFEGEYMFGVPVKTIALFRYEYQENAQGGTKRYIPAIAYAPLQNTRLSLQYVYTDGVTDTDQTTLGSVSFSF